MKVGGDRAQETPLDFSVGDKLRTQCGDQNSENFSEPGWGRPGSHLEVFRSPSGQIEDAWNVAEPVGDKEMARSVKSC